MTTQVPSDERRASKAAAVLAIVEGFVKKQRISCPETIYQTDRVIENAYEFIEELADAAGYLEESDDE